MKPFYSRDSDTKNKESTVTKRILRTMQDIEFQILPFSLGKNKLDKKKLKEILESLIIHSTVKGRPLYFLFSSLPGKGRSSNLQWSAYYSKRQVTQIPESSIASLLWIFPDYQCQKKSVGCDHAVVAWLAERLMKEEEEEKEQWQ